MSYEYKVVPAPARGLKAKGVKTAEDRFALALQTSMNELAADGWEYLRADTLPCEQREGLMSKTTVYQNMLVFRRAKAAPKGVKQPPLMTPAPIATDAPVVEKKLVAPPKAAATPSSETSGSDKKPEASPDLAAE